MSGIPDHLGDWAALPFFTDQWPGIAAQLAREERPVYPARAQMFAALQRVQPEQVRVVILGQDPYPQPGKAHGFAFSIPQDFPPRNRRDSLDNIFAEIEADTGQTRHRTNLEDWADQGVLLLNALALSVPEASPGGHRKLGWQKLTAQVLHRLSDSPRAYLLWGRDAHQAAADVSAADNLKIETSHPSPMGVHKQGKTFAAFSGARPFSRVNDWLQARGMDGINWGDPEDT